MSQTSRFSDTVFFLSRVVCTLFYRINPRSVICKGLTRKAIPLMIIEKDEQVQEQLEEDRILYLDGDATHEETLLEAGIEKAKGLVSVVSSDAENVYSVSLHVD